MWLKHKKIQGFYDVLQVSDSYQEIDDGDYFDLGDILIIMMMMIFFCRTGALQKEPMRAYHSG